MPITPRNVSLTSVLVINFDFHSAPCTFPMYASLIVLDITAALLFFGNCFELRIIYYSDVMFGVQIPASLRAFCFVACQRCGCGEVSPVFFIAEQRVNRTGAPRYCQELCANTTASLMKLVRRRPNRPRACSAWLPASGPPVVRQGWRSHLRSP